MKVRMELVTDYMAMTIGWQRILHSRRVKTLFHYTWTQHQQQSLHERLEKERKNRNIKPVEWEARLTITDNQMKPLELLELRRDDEQQEFLFPVAVGLNRSTYEYKTFVYEDLPKQEEARATARKDVHRAHRALVEKLELWLEETECWFDWGTLNWTMMDRERFELVDGHFELVEECEWQKRLSLGREVSGNEVNWGDVKLEGARGHWRLKVECNGRSIYLDDQEEGWAWPIIARLEKGARSEETLQKKGHKHLWCACREKTVEQFSNEDPELLMYTKALDQCLEKKGEEFKDNIEKVYQHLEKERSDVMHKLETISQTLRELQASLGAPKKRKQPLARLSHVSAPLGAGSDG